MCIAVHKERLNTDKVRKQVFLNHDDDTQGAIQLFVRLMERLYNDSRIIGYNTEGFDWPFLICKAGGFDGQYNLKERLMKLAVDHSFDMMRVKEIGEDSRGNWQSLDYNLRRFGIEHRVDCDGSMVKELYENEEWGRIREYAKEDARTEYMLHEKLVEDGIIESNKNQSEENSVEGVTG